MKPPTMYKGLPVFCLELFWRYIYKHLIMHHHLNGSFMLILFTVYRTNKQLHKQMHLLFHSNTGFSNFQRKNFSTLSCNNKKIVSCRFSFCMARPLFIKRILPYQNKSIFVNSLENLPVSMSTIRFCIWASIIHKEESPLNQTKQASAKKKKNSKNVANNKVQ